MMLIQRYASANFDARDANTDVKFLIMHYTECNFRQALRYLTSLIPGQRVSAHYLIDEDGMVLNLVLESQRAWHAGASYWQGYRNLNTWSIGIELVNPGHPNGYKNYPEAQMRSLIKLSQQIISRHNINPAYILGHSDIAPSRKIDPGELFDWQRLAREGIGIFPKSIEIPTAIDIPHVQNLLATVGYDIEMTGLLDLQTRLVLRAFQMHYSAARVDQTIYPEMVAQLESLCDVISHNRKSSIDTI